jgi:carboxymethylenebutenolidase
MMEIQRYLAEEVAEDHADGIITRREAIRRLGLLGVTGAAAAGLLATFATGEAAASTGSEVPAGHDSRRGALETTGRPSPASRSRSRDPVCR